MSESVFSLPLFPLSAHVLPQGRMSLRIFEPRYVNMVKQACAEQSGFGVCMFNPKGDETSNQHIFDIGTFVHIVDFNLLDDGLLGIEVLGERCFQIQSIQQQPDGLRIGQCVWLDAWQEEDNQVGFAPIRDHLRAVFEQYPDLHRLYPEPAFNNPLWVTYRWLEILPLQPEVKQQLLAKQTPQAARDLLNKLVL